MDNTWIGVVVIVVTILASHFVSHSQFHRELRELRRDLTSLTERVARLEGALTAFINSIRPAATERPFGPDTAVQTREQQD